MGLNHNNDQVKIDSTTGTVGQYQTTIVTFIRSTTDATPTLLTITGDTPMPSTRFSIAGDKAYGCMLHVVGKSATEVKYFTRRFLIQNNFGTTAIVGAVDTIGTDIASGGAAAWTISITADNPTDTLQIEVTGAAATTINWSGTLQTTEVGT